MTTYASNISRLAIVLGCGDVGSAVAHALHRAGFAVALVELLGLVARGARVEPGDTLVEVDSAGAPHACFGLSEEGRRASLRVLAECEIALGSSSCCNTPPSESNGSPMHEEYPQCASS